jgi:hypothetical protein
MGYTHYSVNDRRQRAEAAGFATRSRDEIFSQQKSQSIHESMDPRKALLRESRDSATHPNSIPIIIALDVTGSMGQIPHSLVIDGLPTLMSTIIQHGFPSLRIADISDAKLISFSQNIFSDLLENYSKFNIKTLLREKKSRKSFCCEQLIITSTLHSDFI